MAATAEFAAAWFEYWRLHSGTREQRVALEQGEPSTVVATHHIVDRLVAAGGPDAVAVLADLSEHPPSDVGDMLAYGPLEDLMSDHGDRLVDLIIAAARQRPSFAAALRTASIDRTTLSTTAARKLAPWIT